MLRVVLDANVLVSSLIMIGKPRELRGIIAGRGATARSLVANNIGSLGKDLSVAPPLGRENLSI
jgi:hypothetical protein